MSFILFSPCVPVNKQSQMSQRTKGFNDCISCGHGESSTKPPTQPPSFLRALSLRASWRVLCLNVLVCRVRGMVSRLARVAPRCCSPACVLGCPGLLPNAHTRKLVKLQ
jgi:hypothetical protein